MLSLMKKGSLVKKTIRSLLYMILQLCFLTTTSLLCMADDKNGVAPNTISLPSGPGSIEGLGESFQPMLNTGTAKYAIGISLPAGVSGHNPKLSLSYESGHGDGPMGIGWKFGPGFICRQTERGIPRYVDGTNGLDDDHDGETDEPDEPNKFIGLEGEELVQLPDGTYRARIEGTFLRYTRETDHWVAHLKDGTRLVFGSDPDARVTDRTGTKIFKWLLEKSTDTNGNVIEFYYTSFPGSDNQKYLKEIRYGPGSGPWDTFYFVHLSYEERPDWRKDFRSGFLIKTSSRLKQIDIGIQGVLPEKCAQADWNNDGTDDALIRRYVLSYDGTFPHASYLSKVTLFGSDGMNYLPPISFSYSHFNPGSFISASGAVIGSEDAPPAAMDNPLVDLIDLNRDGLPDILKTDMEGRHTCYLNLGMQEQGEGFVIKWGAGRDVTSGDGLAGSLSLSSSRVHLADMDGNGISDLVHTTYGGEVYYHLNLGTGSWGNRQRMSILDTAPPAPFGSKNVKTSDLDFDKRIDIVKSTENGYSVWFNMEKGKYSREVRTGGAFFQGRAVLFSETGVHQEDMNGDRMNDVARITPTQVVYCANMGHGRFDEGVAMAIPDTVLTDGPDGQVKRASLQDIDGDGLSDLVVERAETGRLWFWLNKGTDTFSNKYVITDMPTQFGMDMETRWADINGNGTTDLIYADSDAASRLRAIDIGMLAGGAVHPNLLTAIDNGLGVRTQIFYKSSTEYCLKATEDGNPWTSTVPFPVSVISRVVTTTGLDSDTLPGNDAYNKDYVYRDGFYDDIEKAFRGFTAVKVIEHGDSTAPTSVTCHGFFTGGPDGVDNDGDGETDEISSQGFREEEVLKGMVRSVEKRAEDDLLFSKEQNSWLVRNLALSTDSIEVRFAYNQETLTAIYEGTDTPETLRVTYTYDEFGNVTEEKNYGALSITGDEVFIFTEFINDTALWILGAPMRQYQTDRDEEKVAETLSYYDGDTYVGLLLGSIEKGNLTRQEGLVKESDYINLVRNAYDTHGNIIGIMDGNGNTRAIAYDATLHIFPVQETISVGAGKPDLVITADYNLGLGGITKSTDFNGHDSYYKQDCFGRLVKIIKPGDSLSFPTLSFKYTMADPEQGIVYSYDESGNLTLSNGVIIPSSVKTSAREQFSLAGTYDSVQYVDGLRRKLALVEEAEEGFVVKEAALFNAKGALRFSFLPYEAAAWDYNAPALTNTKVETRYDAAGRGVLTINPPDKDGVITQAFTQYLPLENIVTDEKSNSKTFINNGLKRLVEVHEANLGERYITSYEYDPQGNLTRITDAQNNVKTLVYNGLGRKFEMNDPDCGKKLYEYDDAGNLIKTTDNIGQVIEYTYDGANRILGEDYLDEEDITPDVKYHYDEPSPDYPDAANVKGKLTWLKDLSGAQFFSHDNRGNIEWTVKRINDGSTYSDHRTAFEYDALGRVVSLAFPDGDRISYQYNNQTLLDSIPGFVNKMNYHPSGQIASVDYANGVTTSYSYDPRQRLTDLNTIKMLNGSELIQDLTYTMDGVSNITAITDKRPVSVDSLQNATQTFAYDNLYRLTHAEGLGYGAINFQYDKIGNIMHKKSPDAPDPKHIDDSLINLGTMYYGASGGANNRPGRMPGDPAGPHAITSTESGLLYDYDDNGNMISHANGDIYSWDFRDRLIRVQKGETDTRYAYDYGWQRVLKKMSEGEEEKSTYYISEGYEIREGKPIKYVFAGSRRIARVEGKIPDQHGATFQALTFKPGWNFFSLDVEPEDPAIHAVLSLIEGSFDGVWTFDALNGEYVGYEPGMGVNDLTELHAQKGYIIKVAEAVTLFVYGTRVKEDIPVKSGWNLVSCPSDSEISVDVMVDRITGEFDSIWSYDSQNGKWEYFDPAGQVFLNDLKKLKQGKAYWIDVEQEGQIIYVEEPAKIFFYHPDHLGSSSVVSDIDGEVVERTEFYPFGRPRHEERDGFSSAYKYTGKELDQENGLMYYGARYYDPVVSRFVSVDPLYVEVDSVSKEKFPKFLRNPQAMNVYAYVENNPIKYNDPSGFGPSNFLDKFFDIRVKLGGTDPTEGDLITVKLGGTLDVSLPVGPLLKLGLKKGVETTITDNLKVTTENKEELSVQFNIFKFTVDLENSSIEGKLIGTLTIGDVSLATTALKLPVGVKPAMGVGSVEVEIHVYKKAYEKQLEIREDIGKGGEKAYREVGIREGDPAIFGLPVKYMYPDED